MSNTETGKIEFVLGQLQLSKEWLEKVDNKIRRIQKSQFKDLPYMRGQLDMLFKERKSIIKLIIRLDPHGLFGINITENVEKPKCLP